ERTRLAMRGLLNQGGQEIPVRAIGSFSPAAQANIRAIMAAGHVNQSPLPGAHQEWAAYVARGGVIEHNRRHGGHEGGQPEPRHSWERQYYEYYVHPDPASADPTRIPGTTRLIRHVDMWENRPRDFWYYSIDHYRTQFVKIDL